MYFNTSNIMYAEFNEMPNTVRETNLPQSQVSSNRDDNIVNTMASNNLNPSTAPEKKFVGQALLDALDANVVLPDEPPPNPRWKGDWDITKAEPYRGPPLDNVIPPWELRKLRYQNLRRQTSSRSNSPVQRVGSIENRSRPVSRNSQSSAKNIEFRVDKHRPENRRPLQAAQPRGNPSNVTHRAAERRQNDTSNFSLAHNPCGNLKMEQGLQESSTEHFLHQSRQTPYQIQHDWHSQDSNQQPNVVDYHGYHRQATSSQQIPALNYQAQNQHLQWSGQTPTVPMFHSYAQQNHYQANHWARPIAQNTQNRLNISNTGQRDHTTQDYAANFLHTLQVLSQKQQQQNQQRDYSTEANNQSQPRQNRELQTHTVAREQIRPQQVQTRKLRSRNANGDAITIPLSPPPESQDDVSSITSSISSMTVQEIKLRDRKGRGETPPLDIPSPTATYLIRSSIPPQLSTGTSNRLLVILDLNGTLLVRSKAKTTNFTPRLNLYAFMSKLMSKYSVMIWSSSMPKNVQGMLDQIVMKDRQEELVGIWARDTLQLNSLQFKNRVQVYKQLSWIWADEKIASRYPQPNPTGKVWDQTNTVLIDDSRLKALAEPYNLLEVPEFKNTQKENDVLGQVLGYLEWLSRYENVSAAIKSKPFQVDTEWSWNWKA